MNSHSRLDREWFQTLLSNAFTVQESGLETQSLSAFVEIERMIAAKQPDVDRAMQRTADRARAIANASGVAIALLQRDQLVYRAGSGSAAQNMGRQLPAVLSVSAHNQPQTEIVRVENAQSDTRIEGAICRQFGAMALLIVPVYRERTVAGVLEVLFDEAHDFQHGEVRAYHLMAGLVGEALSRDVCLQGRKAPAAQPALVPNSGSQIPVEAPMFRLLSESEFNRSIGRIFEAASRAAVGMSVLWRSPRAAFRCSLVAVPVSLVLVISSWIAYDRHTPSVDSALSTSNVPGPPPAYILKKSTDGDQPQSTAHEAGAGSTSSPFQPTRLGKNEIDSVADDVTIRHFNNIPATAPARRWNRQIDIGEDVTVHYFASRAKLQPASAVQTSAEPSLSNLK